MKILGVCGSLQTNSANLTLLRAAVNLMPAGAELILFDGLRDLPLFNPELEAVGCIEAVALWRRAIAGSDALMIATPEYGFSVPGALKNAIDWVIGSGELEGKLVAITASVPGPERGRLGLNALRQTLNALRVTIVGGEPIVRGPRFDFELASLIAQLMARAEK